MTIIQPHYLFFGKIDNISYVRPSI